jgi:DNA-binding NarL/FixJ family response regulator
MKINSAILTSAHLNFSNSAIEFDHISSIFKKLEVTDRTQAAVFAIRNNIIQIM